MWAVLWLPWGTPMPSWNVGNAKGEDAQICFRPSWAVGGAFLGRLLARLALLGGLSGTRWPVSGPSRAPARGAAQHSRPRA
eukprot:1245718-Pyramimonas_sp.AAC.1